jgi:hypothetical protein
MISKDAYILQTNRLYFHKGSSVNSYITSTNIAGANHTNFINEDPNGELRFSTNGSIKMFIRATDMTLGLFSAVISMTQVTEQKNMTLKMLNMTLLIWLKR